MQTFKTGDVVRLRSGSPWFTVEAVESVDPCCLLLSRYDYGAGFACSERVLAALVVKRSLFGDLWL